jgi:hypothetical protein
MSTKLSQGIGLKSSTGIWFSDPGVQGQGVRIRFCKVTESVGFVWMEYHAKVKGG